jgi:hypothetical protein
MIKKYINRNSILYKPYLFFKIIWLEKYFYNKKSYSQFGEDIFISNFFKKKIFKGVYLDIGAFNPIKYNNTLLLYKNGWSGTNIDLNQSSIDLFNIVRPNDNNICAAISNKIEKVKVYIENIFSPLNTISKIRSKELNTNSINKNLYFIKTKRINDLIKNKFDFLNIDIEGMDLKVLKSINLNFYKPKLICIEVLNSKHLNDLKQYLKKFGYFLIKKLGPSYFFSPKNDS